MTVSYTTLNVAYTVTHMIRNNDCLLLEMKILNILGHSYSFYRVLSTRKSDWFMVHQCCLCSWANSLKRCRFFTIQCIKNHCSRSLYTATLLSVYTCFNTSQNSDLKKKQIFWKYRKYLYVHSNSLFQKVKHISIIISYYYNTYWNITNTNKNNSTMFSLLKIWFSFCQYFTKRNSSSLNQFSQNL